MLDAEDEAGLAGLQKPVTALWFRHSLATRWGEEGFNREELMYLLGHRTAEMAEAYLETPPQARVMERFGKLYAGDGAPDELERDILADFSRFIGKLYSHPEAVEGMIEDAKKADLLQELAVIGQKAAEYGKLTGNPASPPKSALLSEAPGGNRTHDLFLTKETLYY